MERMKLAWPAPERNKQPILDVLRRVLPPGARVLEIASGSGQHAAFFAASLPSVTWLPTDVEPDHLASIAAYVHDAALPNLGAPRRLDVREEDWGVAEVDAIFSANLIHIAPWECAVALVGGAARTLRPGGVLVLYGPYRIGGRHTAESNAAFDADLRARDPRWGVRDLEAVDRIAESLRLVRVECVAMPANNQLAIFRHD